MNFLKWFLISLLITFTIGFVTLDNHFGFADDDFDERHEYHYDDYKHEEEAYEDLGETVGWGTLIAMGAAGLILPIRKSAKWTIRKFPKSKRFYLSSSKYLGKYHLFFGIMAIVLSAGHGVAMYISEGELESEGIIGLVAFLLMIIAAVFGTAIFKNKKVKSYRTTHTILIVLALFIGLVHLFTS